MKIEVYRCRFTGQLFLKSEKEEYIEHLKSLREEKREKRKYERLRKTWKTWLAEEKKKITHLDMIGPWVLENQRKIMDAYNALGDSSWRGERWYKTDKIEKLNLSFYNKECKIQSNSHDCPEGGVTNWGSHPDRPKGYPGWSGRLEGKTVRSKKHMSSYPSSDTLRFIGIKTGSGGGGNDDWGYSFTIFLADWPGLQQEVIEHEQRSIVARLKGVPVAQVV